MRILPSGTHGLLLEVESLEDVLNLHAALQKEDLPHVLDIVPAARTLLLHGDRDVQLQDLASRVQRVKPGSHRRTTTEPLELPVRYDGEDLQDVADVLDLSVEAVVARHQDEDWTVAFCGFAPGFGYLTGTKHDWGVPRRDSPRTKVPAGALALAGEFTSVYPRDSPGGWQLIGHAEVEVFDLDRDPSALLAPGTRVRFVESL